MRKNILIVDDEASIVSLLAIAFRELGFEVTPAYDGAEAMHTVERTRFDGAVLDFNLPRFNGRTICAAIKARGATPVIMITGMALTETQARALLPEADGHFLKPFDIIALLDRMCELLGESPALLEREYSA